MEQKQCGAVDSRDLRTRCSNVAGHDGWCWAVIGREFRAWPQGEEGATAYATELPEPARRDVMPLIRWNDREVYADTQARTVIDTLNAALIEAMARIEALERRVREMRGE